MLMPKKALEEWKGPERFDVLTFIEEKLAAHQKLIHSIKYSQLQKSKEWLTLMKVFEEYTSFHPSECLTVSQVLDILTDSKQCTIILLAVSQNSVLEDFDRKVASGRSAQFSFDTENYATNGCTFICIIPCHLLMTNAEEISSDASATQAKVVELAEHSIKDYPCLFNKHRNIEQLYDAQEASCILRKAGLINDAYDLTEEILSARTMFSADGKKEDGALGGRV